MADEDKSTSTVDTDVEEQDKSTVTTDEDDSKDAPADDAPAAGDDDSEDDADDDSSDDGEDEGDDSDAKQRNKSGYLIRQLSGNNPNIQALRSTLQPWVDDAADAATRKDRQRDINDYLRDAATAQDSILRDNEIVAREIPEFNATDKEHFNQGATERAYAQYARDHLIYDQNGAKDAQGNPVIIGTRMRLIDFMREKAEDFGFGSTNSKSQGKPQKAADKADKSKKAKARMDAAADTPGGASNSGGKGNDEEDPFLKGFDNPYDSTHANGGSKPNNAHQWSDK